MRSVKEKGRTSTHSQHGKQQPVLSKALSVLRLSLQRAKIEPLVVKIAPVFLLNTTKAQQMCWKHIYSREEKSEPGLSNAAVKSFPSFFPAYPGKTLNSLRCSCCSSTTMQTSLKKKVPHAQHLYKKRIFSRKTILKLHSYSFWCLVRSCSGAQRCRRRTPMACFCFPPCSGGPG